MFHEISISAVIGLFVIAMGGFAVFRSGNRFGWILVIVGFAILLVPAVLLGAGLI